MPTPRKSRDLERTREEIVTTARRLFGDEGYERVSIDDVCREVGLSRGGFYHHFADKRECFEAVWRSVQTEWHERGAQADARGAWRGTDEWDSVRKMLLDVFAFFADPPIRRINAVDAPSALGWFRWQELEHEFWHDPTAELLRLLGRRNDEDIVRLVFGAMAASAMRLAHVDDGPEARERAANAIVTVMRGLPLVDG